jgi:hypothetical protein
VESNVIKHLLIGAAIVVALSVPLHTTDVVAGQRPLAVPIVIHQRPPDLAAIFIGNYQQTADRFGTVGRTAFDASGRVIGTQVGTNSAGAPNGMTVELTYLQPDAEHPRGQAFDGAGKPMALH